MTESSRLRQRQPVSFRTVFLIGLQRHGFYMMFRFNTSFLTSDSSPWNPYVFFHLDQNWIEAMVEGALSIGGGIAAERELSGAFAGLFREKAANRLRRPRRQRMHENHLIKCKAKENLQPETDFMGFLIRSRLVGAYK